MLVRGRSVAPFLSVVHDKLLSIDKVSLWQTSRVQRTQYKTTKFILVLEEPDVETELCEMYSDEQLHIPSRNCIRSLHSPNLC